MTDKPHMTLPNGEKLFEGEYGFTRNGERVGPLRKRGGEVYPYRAPNKTYTGEGQFYCGKTDYRDIIARADPAISLETLQNLTTPVGLLDGATRKALEDHGGPYEYFFGNWCDTEDVVYGNSYAHRVKKQPKVETVRQPLLCADALIGYCALDKIDGEYDLSTVRPWVEGEE